MKYLYIFALGKKSGNAFQGSDFGSSLVFSDFLIHYMAQMVYNAIVFTGDQAKGNNGFITYRKINSLQKFELFITKEFPHWKWYTFFDNKTKAKLGIKKRDN